MMPELPFVAPCETSSAASSISTEAVVFESSRAIAEPMQPAPTMITSYEPSALAAVRRDRERGHVAHGERCLSRSPLPVLMLKEPQSSMSSQFPPIKAPPSPWIWRCVWMRASVSSSMRPRPQSHISTGSFTGCVAEADSGIFCCTASSCAAESDCAALSCDACDVSSWCDTSTFWCERLPKPIRSMRSPTFCMAREKTL
mmetsp:Transcript_30100/g.60379  ORF Transcript_30100/g.60379 Transcript_30100/m.60379 type:complete len:200 (+) Transcript_30100:200-799(+)